jgi:glucose 1-dehydrogenase
MGRLDGKSALVTASAQGMGRGIALCLAEEGADVMVSDLGTQEAGMKEVVAEIEALGRRAAICTTDVTDRDAVKALVDRTVETFGHLDIAVANAGVSVIGPMLEARWEDVRKTFEVTQFGVFHTCQFAARQMVAQVKAGRPGGKIVITGSVHEELSPENCAAYNMAKAAAVMLGRTLAVELAPHHINVNVVNPGWVDTPGSRGYVGDQVVDEGGKKIIWGRLGTTRDIGRAVVYLASDDADYVTGETLRVDGGFKVGMRLSEHRGYEHR